MARLRDLACEIGWLVIRAFRDKIPPMIKKGNPGVVDRVVEVSSPEGVGQVREVRWGLAAEVPVSLCYNGVAHVVMMASPCDLEDFAVGFSFSERILETLDDLEDLDVRAVDHGYLIDVRVRGAANARVSARRRNLPGQTSCGICGVIELEEALPKLPAISSVPEVTLAAARRALSSLRDHQPLNARSRSLHGAAFCDASGAVLFAREDVGRHNALDKLIGAGTLGGHDLATGFIVMSSRCSVELVQKVAIANIPLLVTASAPTTLAIALAEDVGLTLLCASGNDELAILVDPHEMASLIDRKETSL